MDDFADVLQRDYGLKPQGKSAPMSAAKSAVPLSSSSPSSSPGSIHRTTSAGHPKNGSNRNSRSSTPILGETMQEDLFFGSLNGIKSASSSRNTFGSAASDLPVMYDDVFGGPPMFASPSHPPVTTDTMQQTTLSASSQTYDDIFRMAFKPSASSTATSASSTKGSSLPVFDAPLYDDDIFGGMPGIRNTNVVYDDVFSGGSTVGTSPGVLEDLLGVSESKESRERSSSSQRAAFESGIQSTTAMGDFDVFSGGSTVGTSPGVLEDLLGVSESKVSRERSSSSQRAAFESGIQSTTAMGNFDELLPGFGSSEPIKPRQTGDGKAAQHKSSGLGKGSHGMLPDDPFDVLQVDDPFDVLQSGNWTSDPSVPDLDALKVPAQSSGGQGRPYSNNDIDENIAVSGNTSPHDTTTQSPSHKSVNAVRYPSKKKDAGSPTLNAARINFTISEGNHLIRNDPSNSQAKDQTRISLSSPNLQSKGGAEASSINSPSRRNWQVYDEVENPMQRPKVVKSRQFDEFWISVEDVKLVTQPTAAPPPARRPPLPGSKQGRTTRKAADSRLESNQDAVPNLEDFAAWHESPRSFKISASRGVSEYSNKSSPNNFGSVFDELEEFATGPSRAQKEVKKDKSATILEEEMMEGSAAASASAIAMQEAMERARSKLQDREKVEREREARASRITEDKEKASETRESEKGRAYEMEEKERAREKEAKEREAKAIREKEEREREELEKEVRERHRKEREKEKEREREREREKDRIAVERATQEARERAERAAVERATAEARERAAAEARQRAAVERATVEARERAAVEARERAAAEARERAAVERATAEARERAAAEARERAAVERATAEARERAATERASVERAASEARARAERAAVERANAEARERAAERAVAEARERAERAAAERAAAAREKQQRNENDLEAFFSSNSRPGSAPRQRSPAKGASSEGRQSSKGFSTEGLQRSSNAAPSVRKVAPTTSSADDWTSLFGAAASTSSEFQEVEGESAERRRARWERHQRTVERAAKALEEKNQRDLQSLREQAERHRAGEILDAEIKRWAAGKDGNIRALLSTLQYVLWPECGWQAVSLTDLITAAAVKKVYRKATLCVHPDKVQQKGATIQQKYIAEKVFDLLQEAWNKFNSEELF